MMKCFAIQQTPDHMVEHESNLTCASFEVSGSSSINRNDSDGMYPTEFNFSSLNDHPQPHLVKKKRNQPCQPDPDAEVIAYSPRTLLSTNRFVCEICNKGFQRDQNLQLHRRGHNLPWKLKKRTEKEAIRKKVYVCPEISCAHHDPSRALGDLTGIKKHFFRKHGEKKWKCDKCSKLYAVQSDWKAHAKICGTRDYSCECGTQFSRKDSFISHKGFCDASSEQRQTPITLSNSLSLKSPAASSSHPMINLQQSHHSHFNPFPFSIKREQQNFSTLSPELPPWIVYASLIGPGTTPLHQTTQSQSLFHQNFSPNHHDHDDHNLNPTLTPTTLPFYYPSPPHTASPANVFIKPHQTHLSPHEEFFQSLGSYGVKADAVTGGSTESGVTAGDVTGDFLSSAFFHDDMMMNSSAAGFEGSAFNQNVIFGGIINHQSSDQGIENLHATPAGEFSTTTIADQEGGDNESGEGVNDEMTRDFLGLKSLFKSDYPHEYNWFKGLFEQKR